MEDCEVDLQFKANNPGASRHGNFINYYQFHPPDDRMKFFPKDLWNTATEGNLICLDVGCNSGDLTTSLYNFLAQCISSNNDTADAGGDNCTKRDVNPASRDCYVLGVDIDPLLIERARESNLNPNHIKYLHLDFMNKMRDETFLSFLQSHGNRKIFDVIFCFSVTMWIHLNHGDSGLKTFLVDASRWTNMLVIEPQPWKCYKNAVRRLKRSSGELFTKFKSLQWRNTVEDDIENILITECNFKKVLETPETDWGRRLLFYVRA